MCPKVKGLLVALFILWNCAKPCEAQDMKPCYAMVGDWAARFVPAFGECYMERTRKNANLGWLRPPLENVNCTMKCTAIKIGLLTEEGLVDPIRIAAFVEDFFQENLRETIFSLMAACAQLSAELAEPDRECSRHGLLFTCVRKGFVTEVYKACYPNVRRLKPTYEEVRGNMLRG